MKKYAITSAFLGIICFASYFIIGATVLEDGTLNEPFALLPMGYFFVFVSIVLLVLEYIFKKSK